MCSLCGKSFAVSILTIQPCCRMCPETKRKKILNLFTDILYQHGYQLIEPPKLGFLSMVVMPPVSGQERKWPPFAGNSLHACTGFNKSASDHLLIPYGLAPFQTYNPQACNQLSIWQKVTWQKRKSQSLWTYLCIKGITSANEWPHLILLFLL